MSLNVEFLSLWIIIVDYIVNGKNEKKFDAKYLHNSCDNDNKLLKLNATDR